MRLLLIPPSEYHSLTLSLPLCVLLRLSPFAIYSSLSLYQIGPSVCVCECVSIFITICVCERRRALCSKSFLLSSDMHDLFTNSIDKIDTYMHTHRELATCVRNSSVLLAVDSLSVCFLHQHPNNNIIKTHTTHLCFFRCRLQLYRWAKAVRSATLICCVFFAFTFIFVSMQTSEMRCRTN